MSQTEGAELPEFSERVSGSAGDYRDRLVDFVIAQGIALEFKESIAPALGVSYGGKIALLPGRTSAEEFSTLVHELAHLCCVDNYVVYGGSLRRFAAILAFTTQHNELVATRRCRGLLL